eukprot:scaffold45240_cov309-Isochrysis_galbana.AAC.1
MVGATGTQTQEMQAAREGKGKNAQAATRDADTGSLATGMTTVRRAWSSQRKPESFAKLSMRHGIIREC